MNEIITIGTEIKQRILSELGNAGQCIYVAMAWFTDRDIATALVDAKKRNVSVEIILSSNVQNETVKLMLKGANINVHAFETGDLRGVMHHKFCLIDNKITINGSYNYSYNASNNNVENIHVSDDPSVYGQLLAEFERLRYNIDHNIDLNEKVQDVKASQIQPVNIINNFLQQLNNLVYSSAHINNEEYKRKGYKASKENQGNIDIFRTEFACIMDEVQSYALDDGLANRKNTLVYNVSSAFDNAKENLNNEKQEKLLTAQKNNELEKRLIFDKTSELKQAKAILEFGNDNTGEKGLIQIGKELEQNKLERRTIEKSLVVAKLWSPGNILIMILLLVFLCYLSFFFASALYKMLFEDDIIMKALESGMKPELPKLFDANAIIKIFKYQGALFGFIATIFFLFPILLSNLKLLGSQNNVLNNILFWVGLFIFDIVVAAMVSFNMNKIKSLLIGKDPQHQIWDVFKHIEFWMMFMFGMIPLIITHFLIESIINAYKKSVPEIVDLDKSKQLIVLDEDILTLNLLKDSVTVKIKEKDAAIADNNNKLLNLEIDMNKAQNEIERAYSEFYKKTKDIFDDFNTKIVSGKIFSEVILGNAISAYKSGFIEHLPEYYSSQEVTKRVQEIEQFITSK